MNDHFLIEGGKKLAGTFKPQGNKNAALPLLASSLLSREDFILDNVPDINDVRSMSGIVADSGAIIDYHDHQLRIEPGENVHTISNYAHAAKIRSILIAGSLLHRMKTVVLPKPGGDRIGRRSIETHLEALANLGADIRVDRAAYTVEVKGRLKGKDLLLKEASVTATELLVMVAALSEGQTSIYPAACEPHVQELCRSLVARGAQIEGIGTNRLIINGVKELGGGTHTIGPDYQEIGSIISLAAATGSELSISDIPWEYMPIVMRGFDKLNLKYERNGDHLLIPGQQSMKIFENMEGGITEISDDIWPGIPSDLLSLILVAATSAEGVALFHEKMYESRLYFVDRLIEMGAGIVLCDPHRAVVSGPSKLHGINLSSPDIRAGMALLIAALAAEGETKLFNIDQINRGYENIHERLNKLGAQIELKSSS
jgi:UDP-N-acetylglucosamine 1-carboxyvinyltransferase